jgi:nucleoside-diphosphate-sugar epimerase
MHILITGAYGFVGTNLSNALNPNNMLWAWYQRKRFPTPSKAIT